MNSAPDRDPCHLARGCFLLPHLDSNQKPAEFLMMDYHRQLSTIPDSPNSLQDNRLHAHATVLDNPRQLSTPQTPRDLTTT